EVEATGKDLTQYLKAVNGVLSVEQTGPEHYRLVADHDVRPEAARAVVVAGGDLRRLSVEEPSLDAVYARFFQGADAGEARDAAWRFALAGAGYGTAQGAIRPSFECAHARAGMAHRADGDRCALRRHRACARDDGGRPVRLPQAVHQRPRATAVLRRH